MNILILMQLKFLAFRELITSDFWLLNNVAIYSCYFLGKMCRSFSRCLRRSKCSSGWGCATLCLQLLCHFTLRQQRWALFHTLTYTRCCQTRVWPMYSLCIAASRGFAFLCAWASFPVSVSHWCFLSVRCLFRVFSSFLFGLFLSVTDL